MYAGDDANFTVTILGAGAPAPLDLTGCTILYIASLATGGTLWTITADNSDQDAATGQCTFTLTGAQTAPLENNTANHIVAVTDANGHKTTVLKGAATFWAKGI